MSNVDLGRYSKKLVSLFWDPEPKNDTPNASQIWCLGRRYESRRPSEALVNGVDKDRSVSIVAAHHDPPTQFPKLSPANFEASLSGKPPNLRRSTGASFEDIGLNSPGFPQSQSDDTTTASFEEVTSSASTAPTSANAESEDRSHQPSSHPQQPQPLDWPSDFIDDFESRIWLTYRTGFVPIPKSHDPKASQSMSFSVRLKAQLGTQGFTSDTGWGCMIRSGQSLLANALVLSKLGRDWRRGDREGDEKRLLSLFADDPAAPFSIHKFVSHGAQACGTYPGQWFGPSATANCIEALCKQYKPANLRVYATASGPDVHESQLMSIAKAIPTDFSGITSTMQLTERFQPTLLLINTRLGIDRVTPAYRASLFSCLEMPQAVGIAGGRPSASLHFLAAQPEAGYFFYLDPHHTRQAVPFKHPATDYTDAEIDSFHTRRLRRMHINEMDPSMLIGFLFRDERDWLDWKRAWVQRKLSGKAVDEHGNRVKEVVNVVEDEDEGSIKSPGERKEAVDEVQVFDDLDEDTGHVDDTEGDGERVEADHVGSLEKSQQLDGEDGEHVEAEPVSPTSQSKQFDDGEGDGEHVEAEHDHVEPGERNKEAEGEGELVEAAESEAEVVEHEPEDAKQDNSKDKPKNNDHDESITHSEPEVIEADADTEGEEIHQDKENDKDANSEDKEAQSAQHQQQNSPSSPTTDDASSPPPSSSEAPNSNSPSSSSPPPSDPTPISPNTQQRQAKKARRLQQVS